MRGVGYVPTDQTGSKHQNATANVLAACDHTDISDPFVLFNDDFFVLRPLEGVEVLHRGPVEPAPPSGVGMSTYHEGRAATVHLLRGWGHTEPLSYELHVPLPVHKGPMAEAIRRAAPHRIKALHKRTLYGNAAAIGGTYADDVKIHRPELTFGPAARFVSTNPETWLYGQVGDDLRAMFEQPGPYEAAEEGAVMAAKDLVVVTERTKTHVRLADGRVVQRVYRKGQKVPAGLAKKLGLKTQPAKKSKAATKKAADPKSPPADSAPNPDPGPESLACTDCDFVAKAAIGLQSHRRAKHGGD